jgi:hypothetical protein
VAGEILEHALANAVVGGRDAEGKGVAGARRTLDFLTVYGDDLAKFGEGRHGGILKRADAVLGYDLPDYETGRGSDCGGLPKARTKTCGGHQGSLF